MSRMPRLEAEELHPPNPHPTPGRMADVSGIRKEANTEPWVRETESGGAARPVTLEKDGRR